MRSITLSEPSFLDFSLFRTWCASSRIITPLRISLLPLASSQSLIHWRIISMKKLLSELSRLSSSSIVIFPGEKNSDGRMPSEQSNTWPSSLKQRDSRGRSAVASQFLSLAGILVLPYFVSQSFTSESLGLSLDLKTASSALSITCLPPPSSQYAWSNMEENSFIHWERRTPSGGMSGLNFIGEMFFPTVKMSMFLRPADTRSLSF